jgi:hypothetical protein
MELICVQEFNSMPRPRRLLHLIPRAPRPVADPQSDNPSPTLPKSLDVLLPSCSKACLRAFIADNYPSSSPTDVPTLCTTNTASGFTLGEAALICESAYCAANGQVDKSIFSVCDTVPQAIRPTHDSLTVVPMATSRLAPDSNAFSSALPPAISPPESTGVDATGIASATGAPPIPSVSGSAPPPPASLPSPSPAPSSPPSLSSSSSTRSSSTDTSISATNTRPGESDPFITSSPSPTVAPETQQASGNLSTGQIVGISLAALAIFAFVIGLLLFFYHRRKERNRHRRGSRWSDAIEKQPPSPFSPAEHQMEAGFADGPAAVADRSQRFYAPATTIQEKRRSFWRRSIKPEDIGVAVTPEVVQGGSPTSTSSQRTISQLLPELPNYSLWPAPLRKSQKLTPEGRRELPRPTITFPSTFVESKKANKPPRIVSTRTGNGLPTDPRAQMYKLEQAKNANGKIPLTPVYDNGNVPTTFGAMLASRESALLHPAYSSQLQTRPNHNPCMQPQTVGQQPPVPPKSAPHPPPVHFETTRAHQAPQIRRNSSASDSTSFEDEEDTTPEQETAKELRPTPLSPVVESPRHSPNSPLERITVPLREITYPSPPRSAATSKRAENQPRTRAAQHVDTSATQKSLSRDPKSKESARRDPLILEGQPSLGTAFWSSPSPPPKRDQSPSSLLAKRKGDKAADQMLQRGLRLGSAAANAPVGNRRVGQVTRQKEERGRKGSDTENSENSVWKTPPMQRGGLKSPPVWTPKLTPTRRGEDLYLRVE